MRTLLFYMTKSQIIYTLKKIEKAKVAGYFIEALFMKYHLNIGVLKYISSRIDPSNNVTNKKPKEVLGDLISAVNSRPTSKTIVNKKNLKILKPWLNKMDEYLKILKVKSPTTTKNLLLESEKIFTILNISLTKIFIGAKP